MITHAPINELNVFLGMSRKFADDKKWDTILVQQIMTLLLHK